MPPDISCSQRAKMRNALPHFPHVQITVSPFVGPGRDPFPSQGKITRDDRIASQEKYIDFLADSWKPIVRIMKRNGVIVCRIGQSPRDNYPSKRTRRRFSHGTPEVCSVFKAKELISAPLSASVDRTGFEPATPTLQMWCSTN